MDRETNAILIFFLKGFRFAKRNLGDSLKEEDRLIKRKWRFTLGSGVERNSGER